jgi:hypothetical protein
MDVFVIRDDKIYAVTLGNPEAKAKKPKLDSAKQSPNCWLLTVP